MPVDWNVFLDHFQYSPRENPGTLADELEKIFRDPSAKERWEKQSSFRFEYYCRIYLSLGHDLIIVYGVPAFKSDKDPGWTGVPSLDTNLSEVLALFGVDYGVRLGWQEGVLTDLVVINSDGDEIINMEYEFPEARAIPAEIRLIMERLRMEVV